MHTGVGIHLSYPSKIDFYQKCDFAFQQLKKYVVLQNIDKNFIM